MGHAKSLSTLTGILNLEKALYPPVRNNEVIPHDPTIRIICPLECILAN